jgi:hypothetical protein
MPKKKQKKRENKDNYLIKYNYLMEEIEKLKIDNNNLKKENENLMFEYSNYIYNLLHNNLHTLYYNNYKIKLTSCRAIDLELKIKNTSKLKEYKFIRNYLMNTLHCNISQLLINEEEFNFIKNLHYNYTDWREVYNAKL